MHFKVSKVKVLFDFRVLAHRLIAPIKNLSNELICSLEILLFSVFGGESLLPDRRGGFYPNPKTFFFYLVPVCFLPEAFKHRIPTKLKLIPCSRMRRS